MMMIRDGAEEKTTKEEGKDPAVKGGEPPKSKTAPADPRGCVTTFLGVERRLREKEMQEEESCRHREEEGNFDRAIQLGLASITGRR
jgi:hypothetical protein